MAEERRGHGLTVMVRAGATEEAVGFYSAALGREPDYAAHEDFHEWEICPGAWLQVASGHAEVVAGPGRVRFEVPDLAAEVERLRGLGVAVGEPSTLPEVVAFVDFSDPWGNRLGLYQDLAGEDGPPEVGGSAADESLFLAGIVTEPSAAGG